MEIPSLRGVLENFTPVTSLDSADVVAVYSPKIDAVLHMSLVDKENPGMVWEREGISKLPQHTTQAKALQEYVDPTFQYKILYLRKKIHKNST